MAAKTTFCLVVAIISASILLIIPAISTAFVYAVASPHSSTTSSSSSPHISGSSPAVSSSSTANPSSGNNNNRLTACANQPSQKQGSLPTFCIGQLTVIKQVQGSGTAVPSQFTMHVTGNNPSHSSFPGSSSGTTITLGAGSYQVTESSFPDYTSSLSADCSGAISAGQTKTCIVTNTFSVAHLTVIKHVINDNGGTSTAKDFTISVSGTNVSPQSSFPGAESPGTTVTLSPGSFSVSETGAGGYTQSLSGDCSGTINAGDNKVCTVTNNDNAQTGGASITVSNVRCTGTPAQPRIDLDVIVSGISHDSHSVTFQEQVFSPTGNIVRLHEYTIQADAPDPATIQIGEGILLPQGPTAGTYKIIDIINGLAVSTTFQAPECSTS